MIEGKLVRLRAIEPADAARYAVWMNDAEVTRYLSMRYPITLEAEEAWVRQRTEERPEYGPVHFAVDTREGAHIGAVGFHEVIAANRKARLGISIGDKRYWSKGFGTDTMLTMLRWGFDQLNLHRVDLLVDVENARGIACYRKCGFVEEGRLRDVRFTRGGYHDQYVMGILRREFYEKWGAAVDRETG